MSRTPQSDEELIGGERRSLLGSAKPSSSKRRRSKNAPSPQAPSSDIIVSEQLTEIRSEVGHQKVKRRQTESRASVQKARYEALRSRRRCLSTVGVFTLLSYHKAEHRILDSTPQPTREALFLIFLHHLVMHADAVTKLLTQGATPSGSSALHSPVPPDLPTLNVDVAAKEIELAVPGSETYRASSGVRRRQEESPLRRQPSQISSDPEQDARSYAHDQEANVRKVLKWARETARTYLTALKLDVSAAAQRLVRHLDDHVMQLRGEEPTSYIRGSASNVSTSRKHGKFRSGGKHRRGATKEAPKVHPLVFNPQPPKRHLVTFGTMVQERVIARINNPELMNVGNSARDGRGTHRSTMFGHFMSRAQSLRKGAEGGYQEPSFFDALNAEQLEALTNEGVLKQVYPSSGIFCLNDLAERLGHLPNALLAQLLMVGNILPSEPGVSAPSAPQITVNDSAPSGVSPATPQGPSTASDPHTGIIASAPVLRDNLDTDTALDSLNIPVNNGLINWTFGDPDSAQLSPLSKDEFVTPSPIDTKNNVADVAEALSSARDHSNSSFKPQIQKSSPVRPSGDLLVPPLELNTDSAPDALSDVSVPLTSSTTESTVRIIFRLFPLHTLLFWESVYTLLLSGHWDVMVQQTCKQCALSLDINPEVYDLMMAYTAEAVSETVERTLTDVGGAAEAVEEAAENEIRTLATTNTKSLRNKAGNAAARGRMLKIAGMAIGVGALSALTAGIAAPAFAAGVGALGIAGTSGFATFLGTAGGSAALASLFGAGSASLSGWKYSRRLADIKTFEFHHLSSQYVVDAIATYISEVMDLSISWKPHGKIPRGPLLGLSLCSRGSSSRKAKPPFHLMIGISGWLNSEEDATRPWECLSDVLGSELFALKWEPHLLTALGAMIVRIVGEQFASYAASVWIQMTMTAGTGIILWPVSLMQYAGQLDNTWMTCRERAQQAGALLATALSDKSLVGHRPVTLIGYSMGSRVISFALRELYKRGEFNRVQHAILMGLPGGKSKENWRQKRAVVSGRLVNIYCTTDWILALIYRFMEWGVQVAGLSAIEGVPGVENYDATGLVMSHNDYEKKVSELLSYIGFHSSFAQDSSNTNGEGAVSKSR